jgi:hypothetical protein
MAMTNSGPISGAIRWRVMAVAGMLAFAVACSSSKVARAKRAQQAREVAKVDAAQRAAQPKPAVAMYIQEATFRFGQIWQQFLNQYGDRLTVGSRVVVVIEVTQEGQMDGLRFEQATLDADLLQRGVQTALAATQFDPFTEEMQRELGQTTFVEIRIPVVVR